MSILATRVTRYKILFEFQNLDFSEILPKSFSHTLTISLSNELSISSPLSLSKKETTTKTSNTIRPFLYTMDISKILYQFMHIFLLFIIYNTSSTSLLTTSASIITTMIQSIICQFIMLIIHFSSSTTIHMFMFHRY